MAANDTVSSGGPNDTSERSPFPRDKKWPKFDSKSLRYWILLDDAIGAPDKDGYDDDKSLALVGEPFKESLVLYVNNTPVERLAQGGIALLISDWLVPGRNSVRFVGPIERPMYAKALTFVGDSQRIERVVAKVRLAVSTSTDSVNSVTLSFDAPIEYTPYIDRLCRNEDDKPKVAAEAREYLGTLYRAMQAHDGNSYVKLAYPPWESRPRWLGAKDNWDKYLAKERQKVNDPQLVLQTKMDDIQLLVGERSVLAWSGRLHSFMRDVDYAFSWSQLGGERKIFLQAITLVRIDGRWECW
jgi:hypothetical protein